MLETQYAHFNFVIVDDDYDDQQILLQAWSASEIHYDAVSVYNGVELMKYLLGSKPDPQKDIQEPDFIFLDINMPGQNGFEVLRELKAHTGLQKIPVFIFSTTCSASDQKIMIDLGAKKCYIKPSQFQDYKRIITEVIAS